MNILIAANNQSTFLKLKKILEEKENKVFDFKALSENEIDQLILNEKIEVLMTDIFLKEKIKWPKNSIYSCTKLIYYILQLDTDLKVSVYVISLAH